jgi:hypothetical protein
MAKKDLKAAAAGALADMKQTPAQRMAQHAEAEPASEPGKNDKAFTVWTTPENVRRWKAYQKAKKDTLPTQAAFIETAVREYMEAHPVTDEEKAELLKTLEL